MQKYVFFMYGVCMFYILVWKELKKSNYSTLLQKKTHILIVLALAYMRKKLYLCTEN